MNKLLSEKETKFNELITSIEVKKFLIKRNILESIYLARDVKSIVCINDAKYSPANANNVLDWDDIKTMYNMFIQLGILYEGDVDKNVIKLNKNEALKLYDEYYNNLFKLKLS